MNLIQIAKLVTLLALTEGSVLVSENNNRLLGGDRINITEAPYFVYLKRDNGYFSGGSIIAQDLILADAFQTYSTEAKHLSVLVGMSNQFYVDQAQRVRVKNKIVHENYNHSSEGMEFNIALFRLVAPLKLSDKVKIIPLANADSVINVGDLCKVAGWGEFEFIQLYQTEVPIVDYDTCKESYLDTEYEGIPEDTICAGLENNGIFDGDCGNALVCNGVQFGIASFYSETKDKAGVYTSIQYHLKWIEKNSKLV